jgi:hypothetical protein
MASTQQEGMIAQFELGDVAIWVMVSSGIVLALCLAALAYFTIRYVLRRRNRRTFEKINLTDFVHLDPNIPIDNPPRRDSGGRSSEPPVLLDDDDISETGRSLKQEIGDALSGSGDYDSQRPGETRKTQ